MAYVRPELLHDVYTLCKLITKAYHASVTRENVKAGFRACGLWSDELKSVDIGQLKKRDISNTEGKSMEDAFRTVEELFKSFCKSRTLLQSDAEFNVNGSLKTTSGAFLGAEQIVSAVQEAEEKNLRR